jgi:two-component system sensor histidine kinase RegB
MATSEDIEPAALRRDWIRLRTLVFLRWMAISGQLAALFVAVRLYGVDLNIAGSLAIIGASAAVNLFSALAFPVNRRLTEKGAFAGLLFDILQLAALLYLTGGLSNPFALLMVVPATIAATALGGPAVAVLGLITVALVTILSQAQVPLHLQDGTPIAVPALLSTGFWIAIVTGVLFLALYARRVSAELNAMSDALLATQMALAREQKLTDLSGVVAAAAHELGTPLATIKLASSELADELADRPDLRSDAELIRDQADRCRDILRSMGRSGKGDLQMLAAPIQAVVEEAAEPHSQRRARILLQGPPGPGAQPLVRRRPEIVHGLRNLVQNAVDFASSTVWIDLDWSAEHIRVTITDDGPGFPPTLIGRIGDPFMRRALRGGPAGARPHYEGMGLGLFIAKTLLERTGARLTFGNGGDPFLEAEELPQRRGARVVVNWPRERIEAIGHDISGENRPVTD